MTDGCTKDQDEEADNEEIHKDDRKQERDEMSSRLGTKLDHP